MVYFYHPSIHRSIHLCTTTGKEGTQTVNITVVCSLLEGSDMQLQQSGRDDWAVESSKWISVAEALEPNMYDKYVSLNVKLALEKGFIEL